MERQGDGKESHAEDHEKDEADQKGPPRASLSRLPLRQGAWGSQGQVVGLLNDLTTRNLGDGGDASRADWNFCHVWGGYADSIVEPQPLLGGDAERLAVRPDEPLREDGRRKRAHVVGFERLQVVMKYTGRPGELIERHPLFLAQPAQVRADARHTSSVAYPAGFFILFLIVTERSD